MKPSKVEQELHAAHQAGLHGISYRDHIDAAGGEETTFDDDPSPTGHARNLKAAWQAGDAERRRQRRADITGRARSATSRAAAAARSVTPSPSKADIGQAAGVFRGNGSFTGLVVAAFLIVLLYVLVSKTAVMTSVVSGVSRALSSFMSPYTPLF